MVNTYSKNICICCNKNNFNKKDSINFKKMPITEIISYKKKTKKKIFIDQSLQFCSSCQHMFLKNIINTKHLYEKKNYFFNSNKSYSAIFSNNTFYNFIKKNFKLKSVNNILEVGSNDLYLLKKFYKNSKNLYGIDPVIKKDKNFKKIKTVKKFFNKYIFKFLPKKLDLIICGHTLEHIENPKVFIKDLILCSNRNTRIFLQFPALEPLIFNRSFHQIQHQHINYFSLSSIKNLIRQSGGEVINYDYNNLHYGTLMVCFKKSDLKNIKRKEKVINKITNKDFLNSYRNYKTNLLSNKKVIENYLKNKKPFYVIGAAPMLPVLNFHMDNIVNKAKAILDDDKRKIGKFFPFIKPRIKSLKKAKLENSICMIGTVSSSITTRKIINILEKKRADAIIVPTLTI